MPQFVEAPYDPENSFGTWEVFDTVGQHRWCAVSFFLPFWRMVCSHVGIQLPLAHCSENLGGLLLGV